MKYGALALVVLIGIVLAGCGDADLFEHRAADEREDSSYTMLKGVGRAVDREQSARRSDPY